MIDEVGRQGFALVPGVLAADECERMASVLGDAEGAGRRALLAVPQVAVLARSRALRDLVGRVLGGAPRPVRALYFDKSPQANWHVSWHQDLTVAVRERIDVPGFSSWSIKAGIPHVQPPVELLEQMLAVRLHLDAADENNGALVVLPGSHRVGRLSPEQIEAMRTDCAATVCRAAVGDALVMRPLLVHSSRRSTMPRRRRVLHIEYAACNLQGGLEWHGAA